MVRAAVDDAEGVARRGEVKINLLHHRMIVVLKINGHHAAHGGPHLVQQPAGLAEIDIFRVLPDLGQLHRGAFAIMEQAVENVPQQHLQSGAGAEAAALEYVGNRIGIEALQPAALPGKPGGDSPQNGNGAVILLRMYLQIIQLHHVHGKTLALESDHTLPIGRRNGNDVQINAPRQHAAMLVVRVVAADLRPARRRKHRRPAAGAKGFRKSAEQPAVSLYLSGNSGRCVQLRSRLFQPAEIRCGGKSVFHRSLPEQIVFAF